MYKCIPALDTPEFNITPFFDDANEFINSSLENPNHKVLIHCFAGKSRATAFTLNYLITHREFDLKQGLEHIWKVRSIAAPNPGFMEQLKALEL